MSSYVTLETITALAKERWQTAQPPRLAKLMTTLIDHIHAYAREVELTPDEWIGAINWMTQAGKISNPAREEFILASDVIGLSMLVVQIANKFGKEATPATILGPFHILGSPDFGFGETMAEGVPGETLYVSGKVTDTSGKPLANVIVDVWQADEDGNYESQLAAPEPRLRGLYRTDSDGRYCVRTITPKGYTIPMDGPVGELMRHTSISHFRPAHVHFMVNHPGFKPLTTHIFREGTQYLDNDVVFGVKEELIVPFRPHAKGEKTPDGKVAAEDFRTADYDFALEPA